MHFGDWLRERREERGLSQGDLAKAANDVCTSAYISNLERGVYVGKNGEASRPSVEIVDALAAALNVPLVEARVAAGYAAPDESFNSVAARRAAEYIERTQEEKQEDVLAIMDFWQRRYPVQAAASDSSPKGKPKAVDNPPHDAKITTPVKGRGSNGEENTGTSD